VAPILLAVLAGIVFGLVRRGRLTSIARTRIRHPEFLLIAIGGSLFVDVFDSGPTSAIAMIGLLAGLFFAALNIHIVGMAIIALGVTLNLLPVVLNGSMPVRPEALVEAEMVTADELDRVTLTGARELETPDTILPGLSDTFPVRWTNQVVSLGDLIMMVGLADVVANLMLQRRRRRLPASALPALEAMGWHEEQVDLTGDPVEPIDLRHPPPPDLRDQPERSQPAEEADSSSSASPVQD
jgi:hypothetical protein